MTIRECQLAWNGTTLDLTDYAANGLFVQGIHVGAPQARPVVFPYPSRDGQADYTQWGGPRSVTLSGVAAASTAGTRSAALALLAPFLIASARPVLTYSLDIDVSPRSLTLTPTQWSAPTATSTGPAMIRWSVQWTASDPVALGNSMATSANTGVGVSTPVTNIGNAPTWPNFTIYGPSTAPVIVTTQGATQLGYISLPSLTVASGTPVVIDTQKRTVNNQPSPFTSQYADLDFSTLNWAQLPAGISDVYFTDSSNTGGYVVATWFAAYVI